MHNETDDEVHDCVYGERHTYWGSPPERIDNLFEIVWRGRRLSRTLDGVTKRAVESFLNGTLWGET